MPKKKCLGCNEVGANTTTTIKVTRGALQTLYQVQLCATCFWAMMDFYEVSSYAVQEGLGVSESHTRYQRKRSKRAVDLYG